MSVVKEIREYLLKNYKTMTPDDMATELKKKYNYRTIQDVMLNMRNEGYKIAHLSKHKPHKKQLEEPQPIIAGTIRVKDFVRNNDVFLLVEDAARRIPKGELIEQAAFIRTLPRKTGYGSALEDVGKRHRGRANGKYYWGHPDDITDLKRRSLLS